NQTHNHGQQKPRTHHSRHTHHPNTTKVSRQLENKTTHTDPHKITKRSPIEKNIIKAVIKIKTTLQT
ncbi:hypothetical protein NQU36_27535, partial [Escherichia coli]|uniref:hypothetical protein n=1 Tax=Escherichia coli TaxID=562 RepID=UPI0021190C32